MTLTHWRCRPDWLVPAQTCDAAGTYDHKGEGASGPAHKHTTTTGHPTETSVHPWRVTNPGECRGCGRAWDPDNEPSPGEPMRCGDCARDHQEDR